MDDALYIIVYRHGKDRWQEKTNGTFTDKRLAENYVEILRSQNPTTQYGIVEGPICSPESMAEAEARLGTF